MTTSQAFIARVVDGFLRDPSDTPTDDSRWIMDRYTELRTTTNEIEAYRQVMTEWLGRTLAEAGPVAPEAIVYKPNGEDWRKDEHHGFEDGDEALRFAREGGVAEMIRTRNWVWHKRRPKEGPTDAP